MAATSVGTLVVAAAVAVAGEEGWSFEISDSYRSSSPVRNFYDKSGECMKKAALLGLSIPPSSSSR